MWDRGAGGDPVHDSGHGGGGGLGVSRHVRGQAEAAETEGFVHLDFLRPRVQRRCQLVGGGVTLPQEASCWPERRDV